MMKQFAFASLAALTMAGGKPRFSVSYADQKNYQLTVEPCNDAVFRFPWEKKAKNPEFNCKGWQPETVIEDEAFISFDVAAKKRGDTYKALIISAKKPEDVGVDSFKEETIWLLNDCEEDETKRHIAI